MMVLPAAEEQVCVEKEKYKFNGKWWAGQGEREQSGQEN